MWEVFFSEAPSESSSTSFRVGLAGTLRNVRETPEMSDNGNSQTIRIEHLSKHYPVYERPSHKVLEILTLRRISRHRKYWALRDLELHVDKATTLGIVGRNGSGKSTLLQIIAGIMSPSRGMCAVRGSVAALLELGAGFNPEFTGRENVYLNAAIQGMTRRQVESRMDRILDFAGIGEFVDRPVKTYSSGMFMRLAFSAAIHVDPDILLVDEALAVGDLIFQHRCINRIRRLRQAGKTVLFVTHDLQAVSRFCDRAILLEEGRKLMDDRPEAVVSRYQELVFEREQKRAGQGDEALDLEQDGSLTDINTIPQVHNRFGEGGAQIEGIILHSPQGKVLNELRSGEEALLLVTVSFKRPIEHPIIGFTLRDHLGVEITSSNTGYEGVHLPPVDTARRVTVGFRIKVPAVRPGSYSISPAVAEGNIWEHTIHDWIDNAYIVNIADTGLVYGVMKWPVKVSYRLSEG